MMSRRSSSILLESAAKSRYLNEGLRLSSVSVSIAGAQTSEVSYLDRRCPDLGGLKLEAESALQSRGGDQT